MKREERLRTPADYQRVRDRSPRVWAHPLLVLHVAPNDLGRVRVGVTVSKRVGKAVVRNRVRRRLHAALQARRSSLEPGNDILVVARAASAAATWSDLGTALDAALKRAGATFAGRASV